jgi:hypothetical protein
MKTVNVVRWWAIFGFTMFLLITLSFLHEIFLVAEVPVYFVGCALAVLSLIKIVKASLTKKKPEKTMLPEKPMLTLQKPMLVLRQLQEKQGKDGVEGEVKRNG